MVKKILLINPNFKYFPGLFENFVNYRKLPLGLAYIASYARNHDSRLDIRICDASLLGLTVEKVLRVIGDFDPEIIGISVHTPTVGFARDVAMGTRRLFSDKLIVFGGPHVTALPFENLDLADVCVIGEGERTFYEIVANYSCGLPLDKIKGISLKKDNENLKTEERDNIDDLDELPFPARDLFPKCTYRHTYPYPLKNSLYNTIVTSRGCSFNCNFCLNELMWKRKVRYRSLDNVFGEIEDLVGKYDTSLLFINDDNFTEKSGRVIEFCRQRNKYFSELKWICHSRADSLSLDLLREMKSAGCVEVQVGVESGDDGVLNKCNKRMKISTIRQTFSLLKEVKINQWATFIIGNEGDTRETIEKTISFAKKLDPTYSSFIYLSPFPGTKCFENLSKGGYIKKYDWSEFQFHTDPIFETESLSKELLKKMRKKAYREFYLRPEVIFRYFKDCLISRQWKLMFSDFLLLLKLMLAL